MDNDSRKDKPNDLSDFVRSQVEVILKVTREEAVLCSSRPGKHPRVGQRRLIPDRRQRQRQATQRRQASADRRTA